MLNNKHYEFIAKAREEYYQIGFVPCPAFGNEPIYFNKYGFDHLIWKGNKIRSLSQQRKRIRLSRKAPGILQQSMKHETYRRSERASNQAGRISTVQFWSFARKENDITIIVVVRQTNDGSKHFFSVVDR
jgi:hypothetical protein